MNRGTNELAEWTVVLVNNKDNQADPATSHDFGERPRRRARGSGTTPSRTPRRPSIASSRTTGSRRKTSGSTSTTIEMKTAVDYTVELVGEEHEEEQEREEPGQADRKGGTQRREPAKRGLLLICAIAPDLDNRKPEDPIYTAFAISFPASKSGQAVTYTVNNVYSDEYGGDR